MDWENVFAKDISDKGFLPKIYTVLEFNQRKRTTK